MKFNEANLPMYLKSKINSNWMGKLNRTKEYYQSLSLSYNHYDKIYELKYNGGEEVSRILKDQNLYDIATEQEYEEYKHKRMEVKKQSLRNKILEIQEELEILENTTL
jgi:precorrin-4 methylase